MKSNHTTVQIISKGVESAMAIEHTEDSIYTAIVFGVVCNLSILAEHNFPSSCDHTEFRNVNFDHGALSEYAELCVHR